MRVIDLVAAFFVILFLLALPALLKDAGYHFLVWVDEKTGLPSRVVGYLRARRRRK